MLRGKNLFVCAHRKEVMEIKNYTGQNDTEAVTNACWGGAAPWRIYGCYFSLQQHDNDDAQQLMTLEVEEVESCNPQSTSCTVNYIA